MKQITVDEIVAVYTSRLGQLIVYTVAMEPGATTPRSYVEFDSAFKLLDVAIREAYIRGATYGLEWNTQPIHMEFDQDADPEKVRKFLDRHEWK